MLLRQRAPDPRRRALGFELAAGLVCLAAAVAATWPMAAHFTTHLGGDAGDPFQTIWSWRWMRDALLALRNPFFTDRVYYPHGASLVFQTFDLPTALLTVPLWSVLPAAGVYNAGVLFGFWLTAWGMYRLVRELSGDRLVAIAAGVTFTFVPYHLAHAQGHQHLVSMGWLPLYLVRLHRMLDGRARLRDAALGGLFLALAALASWYHLLFALVLTPVLFVDCALRPPRALFTARFALEALALAGTFLLVAGPLLAAILGARAAEPVAGAHDAVRFSGDLQAFFFPNLAQRWAPLFGARAHQWTGNAAETALYAGYALLLAALVGAVLGGGRARAYLAVALAGATLALGPLLHVGGRVLQVPLPYQLLERALPQVEFMGVPVRFGYLLYLGLVVAAALGLAALRRHANPLAAAALAVIPCALTVVEYAPRPFVETRVSEPAPLQAWARDPARFSVLDLSGDYRMMWNATVHRKPMIGGNLTRVSERLDRWYWQLPIVRSLRNQSWTAREEFERTDPAIDFRWGRGSPDPRLPPDHFAVDWRGELLVPQAGRWTLHLGSDDGASLALDGRPVLDNGGSHPMRTVPATVELAAGAHAVAIHYEERTGEAGVRLEWEGPGRTREVVAGEALRAPDGRPGLAGRYARLVPGCGLAADEALDAMRQLDLRYVITGPDGNACLSGDFGLAEIWSGDGLRVYEVTSRGASAVTPRP